jgi:hypothetical protein
MAARYIRSAAARRARLGLVVGGAGEIAVCLSRPHINVIVGSDPWASTAERRASAPARTAFRSARRVPAHAQPLRYLRDRAEACEGSFAMPVYVALVGKMAR